MSVIYISSGHHGGGGEESSGGGNEGGGGFLFGGIGGADEDLTIGPGSGLHGAVLAVSGNSIGGKDALSGLAWGGVIAGSSVLNGGWGFGGGFFFLGRGNGNEGEEGGEFHI